MNEFKPDWLLPPEPEGDDEPQVRTMYNDAVKKHIIGGKSTPWEKLPEWTRESWRREFRYGD